MDENEITAGEYRQCVETKGCKLPVKPDVWATYKNKPDYPINMVDWFMAKPVEGDVEQLRSVLTNLIVNALEAMASCGRGRDAVLSVSVACVASDRNLRSVRLNSDGVNAASQRLAARELVIAISDTGEGVPVELQEKIFYPFFTTKATGSGIGLATAQKIAASHGGMIELESEAGRGSTFRLRLPVGAAELVADDGTARPTVAPAEWSRPGSGVDA
jgi:signal transduction histidine kinase